MKIKSTLTLYILDLLTIILIMIIHFAQANVLRIIIGLPFVLFIPGYNLITALLPRKSSMDGVQRIALSFGLSIATILLIGLILNYTTGFTVDSVLLSISGFILIISIIAWFRLRRYQDSELIAVSIPRFSWGSRNRLDKVLTVVLTIAIVGAIGTSIYAITASKVGQKFTEFYILNAEGNSTDYINDIRLGDTSYITLGIVNHEYETVSYQVEIKIDGVPYDTIDPIVLEYGEKSERLVNITPLVKGDRQEVELLLYKNGEIEASQNLDLWINVTD